MIGTKQSKLLADFYEKVFGKPAEMVDSENGFFGWQVGSAYFSILEHSEMGGGWIATLADPEGNYFQLVTPM